MTGPQKLSADCILEALIEVRFDVDEPTEVVVGRLLDCPLWSSYQTKRTPIYDIPIQVRLSDSALRYKPIYELVSPDKNYIAKIGTHAFSLHAVKPYPGWKSFKPLIDSSIEYVCEKLPKIKVKRLGLRYVNATTKDKHYVSGLGDLNIDVRIADDVIESELNINYKKETSENHLIITRIAAPSFVSGPLPDETTSYIDIDVHTKVGWKSNTTDLLLEWIEKAHLEEKEEFFKILPQEVIEKLREE